MSEPKHIYDWLDEPATNDAEASAKKWLSKFCVAAVDKDHKWLDARQVFCTWKGKSYQCTGASRMGDVWIKSKGFQGYYEHRVDVDELSDWKVVMASVSRP